MHQVSNCCQATHTPTRSWEEQGKRGNSLALVAHNTRGRMYSSQRMVHFLLLPKIWNRNQSPSTTSSSTYLNSPALRHGVGLCAENAAETAAVRACGARRKGPRDIQSFTPPGFSRRPGNPGLGVTTLISPCLVLQLLQTSFEAIIPCIPFGTAFPKRGAPWFRGEEGSWWEL